MKTIDPQHAQDLFHLYDDHELLDPEDQRTLHGFTVLGSVENGNTGRWHERYWMLLRDDADGAVWGVEYGVGLTEDQEDDHPWDRYGGNPTSIPLVRLDRRERTVVEYVEAG